MGNAPSQQEPQQAPDAEAEEPFDLDKIPDDREPTNLPPPSSAVQSPVLARSSPTLSTDSMDSAKKKKRRRGKKRKDASGSITEHGSLLKPSVTPSGTTTESLTESMKALREREPETFGEYAMSDESDAEGRHLRATTVTTAIVDKLPAIDSIEHSPDVVATQVTAARDAPVRQHSRSSSPQLVVDGYETAVGDETESYGSEKGQLIPDAPEDQSDGEESNEEVEHNVTRFPCPYAVSHSCNRTLTTARNAERHGLTHVSNFVCAVCGKKLARPDILLRHEKRHTAQERQEAENRNIQHNELEESEAQPVSLRSPSKEPGTEDELAQSTQSTQLNGKFSCPYAQEYDCQKTFASQKSAVRHGQGHASNFICSICGTKLSRLDVLTKHEKNHTAEDRRQARLRAISSSPSKAAGVLEQNSGTGQGVNGSNHHRGRSASVAEVIDQSDDNRNLSEDNPVQEPTTTISQPVRSGFVPINTNRVSPAKQRQVDRGSPATEVDTQVVQGSSSISLSASVAQGSGYSSNSSQSEPFVEDVLAEEQDVLKTKPNSQRPIVTDSPKRKRSHTPPTSSSSDSAELSTDVPNKKAKVAEFLSSSRPSRVDKSSQAQVQRQSSMDGWAQPFEAGSRLRHPLFNPKSPVTKQRNVQVIVPSQSRAGPSKTNSKNDEHIHFQRQTSLEREESPSRSAPLHSSTRARPSSLKGKEKAVPSMNYLSPAKRVPAGSDQDSDDQAADMSGMATSVARRSLPKVSQRHKANLQPRFSSSAKSRSASTTSDGSSENTDAEPKQSSKLNTPDSRTIECTKCHRTFTTKKLFREHAKKPSVHENLHQCHVCSEEYWSRKGLADHMKQSGHAAEDAGVRERGHFSEAEERKIQKWRKQYCDFHDLTKEQFGDMVTASIKVNTVWPYTFTTRRVFNEEFYNVLPKRDVRSMRRYRERHFQNLANPREWSNEDDEELSRLHHELGPKWAEIGEAMRRSSDAVRVRWRNKFQNANRNDGTWTPHEEKQFSDAIQDVAAKSISTPGNKAESTFYWSEVSKLMGSRTPQQCSNHWRSLHGTRIDGRWVIPQGFETPVSKKNNVATPSKMAQRLAGNQKSIKNRTRLSEALVMNSDDEDDADDTPLPEMVNDTGKSDSMEVDDIGDSEQSENNLTSLKRSKVTDKTPSKTLTTSQAFAQTQANTSARRSMSDMAHTASQDPPSPEIPLRHRRTASPLLGTDDEINSASDREQFEDQQSGRTNPTKRLSFNMGNTSADDEENDSSSASSTTSSRIRKVQQDALVEDEAEEEVEENSGDSSGSSSSSTPSTSSEADESTSSEASASGDDDDDDHEVKDEVDEEMDDSMIQDTKKDLFIQSITSSASNIQKSAQQQQKKKKRKRLAESGSESEIES